MWSMVEAESLVVVTKYRYKAHDIRGGKYLASRENIKGHGVKFDQDTVWYIHV